MTALGLGGLLLAAGLVAFGLQEAGQVIDVVVGPYVIEQGTVGSRIQTIDKVAAQEEAQRVIDDRSDVHGLTLMASRLAVRLRSVSDLGGSLVFSSGTAEDLWVFVYEGPPQNGYGTVAALVMVEARTGTSSMWHLLQSNP